MREIDAKEVCETVRRSHGLEPRVDGIIAARLKHMHRVGLLAESGVGKGSRRLYSFSDVVRVACAFRLLDVGMSSALAVHIVETERALFAAALRDAARTGSKSKLIALEPRATITLGALPRRPRKAWGEAQIIERSGRRSTVTAPVWIVFDPAIMLSALRKALLELGDLASDEIDEAMRG